MDQHIQTVEYGVEGFESIKSFRISGSIQADTLTWRLITADNRVLVVRPVQIPSCSTPAGLPTTINPVLRGRNENLLFLIERIRKSSDKADLLNEVTAILQDETGKKRKAKEIALSVIEFIRELLQEDEGHILREYHLRRIVSFVNDKTESNQLYRTVYNYHPKMKQMVDGWVDEVAAFCKVGKGTARGQFFNRVTYIAEYEGGRFNWCYPIEDISYDLMNQADRAPYEIAQRSEAQLEPSQIPVHAVYERSPKKKKGPGRPPDTDHKADAEFYENWQHLKNLGTVRTYNEMAELKGISEDQVKLILNREGKRRRAAK